MRAGLSVVGTTVRGMAAPMRRAKHIAAALRGTYLQGHVIRPEIGETFVVSGVDPARLLEAWQAAHAVMPVTGRWPVFTLPGELHHGPSAAEIAELRREAQTLDPWPVFTRYRVDEPRHHADVERYVRAFLGDEMVTPAMEQLGLPTTTKALTRWTYDTLLANPHLADRVVRGYEHLIGTRQWHTFSEVQLVLLPTTSQWLAPAWVQYHGTPCENGVAAWAAAMRQWEQRWGAALIAAWGTMLQFTAQRQPPPGPRAWELAGQLMAVGGSLQCQQWQLAIALTRSDAWFLHDRP
ncbi:protein of unknown function (DUF4253) [Micromonospora matsumotoense]|uniref:DUF4253 domain-containing protein n=2 Tax=Micromonospora matsumotoense TaxID=121616 RepID=A0A1C5AC41_9ACTN|nr:protein of unknown function (DUF4253) [Micromonospora matsumotoense]